MRTARSVLLERVAAAPADGFANMRHPDLHRASRDEYGVIRRWGTRDVIALQYGAGFHDVRSLDSVSRMVRYQPPISFNTDRFWDEYDRLASACGARPSART